MKRNKPKTISLRDKQEVQKLMNQLYGNEVKDDVKQDTSPEGVARTSVAREVVEHAPYFKRPLC